MGVSGYSDKMNSHLCKFGLYLKAVRTAPSIDMPQWLLAAKCEIVATNLRKIELGQTQPGVMLAIRLLHAVGVDVGESLFRLAKQEQLISDGYPAKIPFKFTDENILAGQSDLCPFGPLYKEVRLCTETSQKNAAEFAKYNLRNMLEVEAGRREPGVMTALSLVCATGCDISIFFDELSRRSGVVSR